MTKGAINNNNDNNNNNKTKTNIQKKINALMFINNINMSLQGSFVRQITAEILHHVTVFSIIYMDNLLAIIFYCIFESI